ncbi:hypothetical protein ASG29_09690 [Sphingomonas sp. Leaf412]|uniref:MFS transporter n=1 Tax=Sphingomonas sp. Leaf412 TaxID=1736370 RepID=UPI0006F8ABA5|nr:MFS transporter [Sphingomonas sp. Leaf412]KQT32108.1 hypothetical protein ASG29_09690 [Sphingomonas sp. Leaf412]
MGTAPDSATDGAGEWRAGWPVVAAGMLAAAIGPGLFQNLSSLFTPGLEAEFGWTRGQISTAAGVALIAAVVAPVVGRLADRIGLRPVIVATMLLLGAGYVGLASMTGAIWQYQLAVVLLVLAVPGTSSLVYGKLIAAAFVRHRGLALAISTAGLAVATIVAPPAIGAVIAAFGWRGGLIALGIVAVGVVLPAILLALRGMPAGPTRSAAADAAARPATGVTAAEARRDPRFWRVVASAALVNGATTGLVTQVVPLGIERGLSGGQAALLLTAFGASAVAGRLSIGVLIDRFRPQPVAAAFALVSAIAFLLLASGVGGLGPLLLLVFLAGLMNGAENDLLPFLTARLFGLRAYAEIFGSGMPVALAGTGIGVIGFGRLRDAFGDYRIALLLGAAALVAAGLCFLLLGDRALPDAHGAAHSPDH